MFTIGLLVTSEFIANRTLGKVSLWLFGLGLLVLFISTLYQFSQRHWTKGVLTLLLLGGTILAFVFYSIASFWEIQDSPDEFANNLKIPTDIQIYFPIDMGFDQKRPDSLTNLRPSATDFRLYSSFQPGLYEYDFWIGKIESGSIYLKAYEITHTYPLSTSRLPERSSIIVSNSTDSLVKFSTTNHFTIYEGDWGKPYAARFEVWFKPDDSGQERKLFEKNYKIEGWMR